LFFIQFFCGVPLTLDMSLTEQPYKEFLIEVKEKIYQSQLNALKAVNSELIALYWSLGKSIVEKQEEYGWGKSVVEQLSEDLRNDMPGVKGYSSDNLWRMRKFYLRYKENEKLAPLVQEIGWSHNIVIMEKCKDDLEREFYMNMTKKYGWSKNVLIHQVEGKSYERFLANQTNFDSTLAEKYKDQAKLAVKDSYSFDFLELSEEFSEREMELELMRNIRKFLMEMGGDFAFMGNQYRLIVGEEEFFIDLLLYHRRLKSLIVVELKTTKFKPEYAGKMQFYLTALNETVKMEEENSSIGIIICKEKDRTTVEFALKDMNSPMGVATYRLQNELPDYLEGLLPSPEEIAKSLEGLMDI
jgi:predicted nuclease of restriction endonuclease-like (RecB) superfamily